MATAAAATTTPPPAKTTTITVPPGSARLRKLHLTTGWKEQTGSNIGGTAPAAYAFTQGLPWQPKYAELSVTGIKGKFCDWLIGGKSFPLPTTVSNFVLNHAFMLGPNYLPAIQARELDSKFTDENGITYNGSSQMNFAIAAGQMHFQVDKAGGGWVDSGIVLPAFTAEKKHRERIQYQINRTAKTYSVVAYELDGVAYALPSSLQNLPGSNVGWAKSEILPQLQQDVNETGGSWAWQVQNLSYDLW